MDSWMDSWIHGWIVGRREGIWTDPWMNHGEREREMVMSKHQWQGCKTFYPWGGAFWSASLSNCKLFCCYLPPEIKDRRRTLPRLWALEAVCLEPRGHQHWLIQRGLLGPSSSLWARSVIYLRFVPPQIHFVQWAFQVSPQIIWERALLSGSKMVVAFSFWGGGQGTGLNPTSSSIRSIQPVGHSKPNKNWRAKI